MSEQHNSTKPCVIASPLIGNNYTWCVYRSDGIEVIVDFTKLDDGSFTLLSSQSSLTEQEKEFFKNHFQMKQHSSATTKRAKELKKTLSLSDERLSEFIGFSRITLLKRISSNMWLPDEVKKIKSMLKAAKKFEKDFSDE